MVTNTCHVYLVQRLYFSLLTLHACFESTKSHLQHARLNTARTGVIAMLQKLGSWSLYCDLYNNPIPALIQHFGIQADEKEAKSEL